MSPPWSSGCESTESRNSQLLHLLTAWPQAALGHSHCVFAQYGVLKCETVSWVGRRVGSTSANSNSFPVLSNRRASGNNILKEEEKNQNFILILQTMLLLLSSSENGMVPTTLGSGRRASAETCGPQARGGGSAYTTGNRYEPLLRAELICPCEKRVLKPNQYVHL